MAVVTPPSAALVQELRKKFNQKLENDGTKVQGKITLLIQYNHIFYMYSAQSQMQFIVFQIQLSYIFFKIFFMLNKF